MLCSRSHCRPLPGLCSFPLLQGTVELITLTLLPVSILMIAYALFTFYWRSEFIRRKQVGFFDDKVRSWLG